MSSTLPSSTSSFRSSIRGSTQPFLRTSSTEPSYNSAPGYIIHNSDKEGDEEDYTFSMMTTTIIRPPQRATTPQAHPFTPATPMKAFAIKREVTPSTPAKAQYTKQTTPKFQMHVTLFSPSASPTKDHVAHQSPLKGDSEEGANIGPSFDQLCPCIPHPDELVEPSPVFPAIKKWYIITTGQEVGIFPSWLDVTSHIHGVSEPAHVSCPTYSQAIAEYRQQFDKGAVHVVLVPGSKYAEWAKMEVQAMMAVQASSFEDEYGEFTYDEEDEKAIYEAEKAYKDILWSHGFPVLK